VRGVDATLAGEQGGSRRAGRSRLLEAPARSVPSSTKRCDTARPRGRARSVLAQRDMGSDDDAAGALESRID
jgi:hypothetical protein